VIEMNIGKAREILRIEDGLPEELLSHCDAIWIYSEKAGEPHAILTSGAHSNGYINLNAVLQFPNLCQILAKQLIEAWINEWPQVSYKKVDAIASTTFAAIPLGQEVAKQLRAMFVFTEKKEGQQKWSGRFELPEGATILQVEELITTLGTARQVKEAILVSNPSVKFLGVNGKTIVMTVVHRPARLPIPDTDYIVASLITKEIHNWAPELCPLCEKGSPALKPKLNWQRFMEYR
jgi:orotate phosphoribosyltransferase